MLARGSADGPRRLMIWRICCLKSLSCATFESSVEAHRTKPSRWCQYAGVAGTGSCGLPTIEARDLGGVDHGRGEVADLPEDGGAPVAVCDVAEGDELVQAPVGEILDESFACQYGGNASW